MTFKIGTTDYSGHVIAGSYKVNNEPQYQTWKDASQRTHRQKLRDQVVGSFDMFFRTVSDYEDFKSKIAAAKDSEDDSVSISVTVNNTSTQADIHAFVDYKLVRNIDGAWNDYFERYTVTIEER